MSTSNHHIDERLPSGINLLSKVFMQWYTCICFKASLVHSGYMYSHQQNIK